jgi:hypothetical protein
LIHLVLPLPIGFSPCATRQFVALLFVTDRKK